MRAQDAARPVVRQELWTSIGLQGRPTFLENWIGKSTVKRIKTTGEVGYRSADSFFAGRQYYFDLGADYKVSDHITVGSEFRYAIRTSEEDRQRLGGKFQYELELGRADIAYRLTYQHNFRDFGEVREVFMHAGGKNFAHIPCLNDTVEGMSVIEAMVRRELQGWI